MSLRGDYTKNGFGLVIAEDDKDAAYFLESTKKALGTDASEPWQYTLPERMESKGAVGDAAYFDESADTMFIAVDRKPGEYIEDHNLFVFPADRQPDPFAVQYTRESVVEEFRGKLGRYLHDGFDYMAHIGFFTCTVHC
jgi:hypothetical protein